MRVGDDPLLLDTSVWVHYLRPRQADDLKTAVDEALAGGLVATCWVVKAELLIGARDSGAFADLSETLGALPDVLITGELWEEAARLGNGLRTRGLRSALPDLVIAQCAIHSGRVLWHSDAGFERIRSLTPLRTKHWSAGD